MAKATRSAHLASREYCIDNLSAPPMARLSQDVLALQVRLTFKPAEQQVWIGSAASTQKGWRILSKRRNSSFLHDDRHRTPFSSRVHLLPGMWSSLVPFVAVYYAQIKKIESHVIQDNEEYSMVAFHLNAEGKLSDQCSGDCKASCKVVGKTQALCSVSNSRTVRWP